ncbi:MAG: aminotransferase class I/II-fold pyridoxal phosphate-dependent enzyme [Chloroflexota bacterium]
MMRLPPFQLDRYLDGREHARYGLGGSVCHTRTVADVLQLEQNAESRLLALPLDYQPYAGHLPLRETLAGTYDKAIAVENVLVTSGVQEGVFALMNTLLEPGDHIVVQAPCYQLLRQVAETIGCTVTDWYMDENGQWDFEWLADQVDAKTKLIVINTPHNPTGEHFTRVEFDRVFEIANQYGSYVLSDEVYRYLEHDASLLLPAGAELYPRAISVSDMSKTYGVPGTRVGWMVCQDTGLLNAVLQFKDYMTITGTAVGQFIAELVIRHRDVIIEENRAMLREHAAYLAHFAERHADRLTIRVPSASTTTFPRFHDGTDVRVLAETAFNAHELLLVPGDVFGDYGDHIRLGFGAVDFRASLDAFGRLLEA